MFLEPSKYGVSADSRVFAAIHDNIWFERRFEGRLNAGNVYGFSLVRRRIDALGVPLSAQFKGAHNKDLKE